MKKYKLFQEGMKSLFGNDFISQIGINSAQDSNYGLCYADENSILNYYEQHGYIISEVEAVGVEQSAILPSRKGEYSSEKIYVHEPRLIFQKEIMLELDQYGGF